MSLLLLRVAGVLYLLTAGLGIVQLLWPRDTGDRLAIGSFAIAILAHAVAIGGRTVEIGSFPVASLHDGLSIFGFLSAIIGIVIAWRSGIPQSASLSALLVTGMVLIAAAIGPTDHVPPHLRSIWLPVHIAVAFLGDAAFAIAGIVSVVYLVQERRLKLKKKLSKVGTGLHRLPALEILDIASVRLIQLGFPLMTLGLTMGAIYAKEARGHYWAWDPLNTVSLLVWILYAVLLHARMTVGWRGRKAAILTVIGVIMTLVAFVVLGIAGVGAHAKEYVS